MATKRAFASDNFSGVHSDIMQAILGANEGHSHAYGGDEYTKSAVEKFKEHFGDVEAFFVFNGTGANVLGLKAATEQFNSLICAETSHLNVDECGAPERFTGCKLLTIPTQDGKITIEGVKKHLHGIGFEHHSQPRVLSITQSTEYGTVYSLKEMKALADFAHLNNLLFHVDGARLSNAAAALGVSLKQITAGVGVDILSFGGTKNGMMYGEAIVFFNKEAARDFKYVRKQGMQLASKMRFISAQFEALLSNDLWLRNARHSNKMAKLLELKVKAVKGVKVTRQVEANAVFALIPKNWIPALQKKSFFWVWSEEKGEVRWMTTFDTTQADINSFVDELQALSKS